MNKSNVVSAATLGADFLMAWVVYFAWYFDILSFGASVLLLLVIIAIND